MSVKLCTIFFIFAILSCSSKPLAFDYPLTVFCFEKEKRANNLGQQIWNNSLFQHVKSRFPHLENKQFIGFGIHYDGLPRGVYCEESKFPIVISYHYDKNIIDSDSANMIIHVAKIFAKNIIEKAKSAK